MTSENFENLDRISVEDGGDLYLINGNMTKLADAGIFAATTAERKENEKGMKKFWNWKNRTVTNQETQEQTVERTLFLNGTHC